MGKMFFNILATFAEFEADLIRLRTREGMAIARAKGKLRGKSPKLSDKQQKELCRTARWRRLFRSATSPKCSLYPAQPYTEPLGGSVSLHSQPKLAFATVAQHGNKYKGGKSYVALHENLAWRASGRHYSTGCGSEKLLSKDTAARVEAIPIQTLTISDEQFLKGDAYGKPTTIAGVLRIAQGSGRLPVVILVAPRCFKWVS